MVQLEISRRRVVPSRLGRRTFITKSAAAAGLLQTKVIPEVRAPLPSRLEAAQSEGLDDFYSLSADPTP
jgi:hypothetical protein